MGGPCYIARPDIGRGRDRSRAIRRGMSKNVRRQYLTCPSELCVSCSVTKPVCLRNGARETREKARKGMRGVGLGGPCTSADPTLDAIGTRSCAIRRGMSKNVQRQYLTCPSELSSVPLCYDLVLAKEWGPRNTRKDAKGDERCGLAGPGHIARPDIGQKRDALLRDPAWHVQKTCNGNI